jgi:hypothetical protein
MVISFLQIGECVSVWRRPYVDSVLYPYPNSDRLIHVVHLILYSLKANVMLC